MDTEINWGRIARAIAYYKSKGYTYVELPWTASMYYLKSSVDEDLVLRSDLGHLIGSAEQSFVEAQGRNTLGKGKFVACTPCFRDDDVDGLHSKMFMKVELYQNIDVDEHSLYNVIKDASDFFNNEGVIPWTVNGDRVGSKDIEVRDIEIGSYGIRLWSGMEWIYGTGLAEPRFSKVLEESAKYGKGITQTQGTKTTETKDSVV